MASLRGEAQAKGEKACRRKGAASKVHAGLEKFWFTRSTTCQKSNPGFPQRVGERRAAEGRNVIVQGGRRWRREGCCRSAGQSCCAGLREFLGKNTTEGAADLPTGGKGPPSPPVGLFLEEQPIWCRGRGSPRSVERLARGWPRAGIFPRNGRIFRRNSASTELKTS